MDMNTEAQQDHDGEAWIAKTEAEARRIKRLEVLERKQIQRKIAKLEQGIFEPHGFIR
jgi:hypothetical protein